jgi:mannose-6-phosphate isomerase-like protein (cupin superfamily)
MELKLVSEDHRRKLSEMGEGGNWKVCKVLEVKEDCRVGDHYHKRKDEMFLLIEGSGTFIISDEWSMHTAPFSVFVPRGTYHAFILKKGSVLIGLATELHDPIDDYKL